jgi:hypothetical protein
LVKPKKHVAAPLPWTAVIGVLRAAHGAGWGALERAKRAGYDDGYKRGIVDGERRGGDGYHREQLEELEAKVAVFEKASGVDVLKAWNGEKIGEAVRIVEKYLGFRGDVDADIRGVADGATAAAERLYGFADNLTAAFASGQTDCTDRSDT